MNQPQRLKSTFLKIFVTPHLRPPSTRKKIQNPLILAFEANSASLSQKYNFPCVLAHCAKGDGTCDDILNIELCEYDGGDCCLQEEIDHCHDIECACHINENPNNITLTTITSSTQGI